MVEPVDNMDNKPWGQDLLDWLAYRFTEDGYDFKKLMYLMTTSKADQLPSVLLNDANQLFDQKFVFKGMVRKKMSAEQYVDALSTTVYPVYQSPSFEHIDIPKFNSY